MATKQYNGITYDTDADYQALIDKAVAAGDHTQAALYEQQRNAKITGEGLNYPTTSNYVKYLPGSQYTFDPTEDADYVAAKQRSDAALAALTRGESFTYNPDTDPVYRQYAERYLREGSAAMQDTVGQAAALTGGYGSTYAESAGAAAYERYLARLNDVLPELYEAAYKRHRTQQSDRADAYARASAEADKAYDRARDVWQTRLELERDDADAAAKSSAAASQQAAKDAATLKKNLVELISRTGYTPTDAELQAAGMTRAEANAWKVAFQLKR